jgi:hypothetical protein
VASSTTSANGDGSSLAGWLLALLPLAVMVERWRHELRAEQAGTQTCHRVHAFHCARIREVDGTCAVESCRRGMMCCTDGTRIGLIVPPTQRACGSPDSRGIRRQTGLNLFDATRELSPSGVAQYARPTRQTRSGSS